jgi:hypothetical protein
MMIEMFGSQKQPLDCCEGCATLALFQLKIRRISLVAVLVAVRFQLLCVLVQRTARRIVLVYHL